MVSIKLLVEIGLETLLYLHLNKILGQDWSSYIMIISFTRVLLCQGLIYTHLKLLIKSLRNGIPKFDTYGVCILYH